MPDTHHLGSFIRRFLLEHLRGERNLSSNTQQSYRDTLRFLLPWVARHARKPIDRLEVEDLDIDRIRAFLQYLETERNCGIATRNQRLAAVRSLARFIAIHSPEHICWCADIRAIPFKKGPQTPVTYLEKSEMDALLSAPSAATAEGRRDRAVLLFLYNTGARADEAAHVRIADLALGHTPRRDPSSVLIRGKGNKLRRCPLWESTAQQLRPLIDGRDPQQHTFLNRRGHPLTRFGMHALVKRCATTAALDQPSIAEKRVSPHTIRHTTATHLLRAGVDINTIRAWLGHVSLSSTHIYAEVDLEMKAKALAACAVDDHTPQQPWRENADLMTFLNRL